MLDRRLRGGGCGRWWRTIGLAIPMDPKPLTNGFCCAFSTRPVGLGLLGDGKNGSAGASINMRMIYASNEKVFLVNMLVRSHFPNSHIAIPPIR
jgi:hypothetical protein